MIVYEHKYIKSLLYRICRKSIGYSFVSIIYYEPTMVGTGEKFSKIKVLRRLESAILRLALLQLFKNYRCSDLIVRF